MSYLGSLSDSLDLYAKNAAGRSDTIEKGVGLLVDANMENESARLGALQTQQQLAVQSLSIANSAPASLTQLFHS
jgi:flagellin